MAPPMIQLYHNSKVHSNRLSIKVSYTSKTYLEFVLEQLSGLEDISYRAVMGEFIIYYRGKIIGGIYDDRLLVKSTKSAVAYMPTASYEQPYEGAKKCY